jgi:hypothetical protein
MKNISFFVVVFVLVVPPAYSQQTQRPAARLQGPAGLATRIRFHKHVGVANSGSGPRCAQCKK